MKKRNKFAEHYFKNLIISSSLIDYKKLEKFANELAKVKKKNGRLFFIGVGGRKQYLVNPFGVTIVW
mgnify:CR=1 FL=1